MLPPYPGTSRTSPGWSRSALVTDGWPASARTVPATAPATITSARTATRSRRLRLRPPQTARMGRRAEIARTFPWCVAAAARVQRGRGQDHGPFRINESLAGLGPDGQVAASLALVHADLGRDALPQLGDVADDTDHPAAFAQAVEHGHHLFQGVLIQAAEPLVDEQRLDPGPARLGGDDVREAERERQAGQERLAAGQRAGVPVHPGPGVAGEQAEPGTACPAARVGVHERVPP